MITMTRRSTAVMVCGLGLVACRPGANSAAQATSSLQESRFVANCEPCLFRIGPNLRPYAFRFHLRVDATGRRAVDSVFVSTAAQESPNQRLAVREMAPIVPADSFFVTVADVNFDGFRDFGLATSRGVVNTYVDYWLFRPATQTFSYLGNFPLFRVDTLQRRLSTYERGGAGGMLYEAKVYEFIADTIALVEVEKQEATDELGVFRKTVSRLVDGKLRVVSRARVTARPH